MSYNNSYIDRGLFCQWRNMVMVFLHLKDSFRLSETIPYLLICEMNREKKIYCIGIKKCAIMEENLW